jgi:glycine/D-amino acid oxidase-like deaminating enzyme
MKKVDAVVVGGGIVGVCSALWLQRTGRMVTLIERDSPGAAASGHNGGVFNVGESVPIGTPGVLRSIPRMLVDPQSPLVVRYRDVPRLAPWLARFVLASRPSRVEQISAALKALTDLGMDGYLPLVEGGAAESQLREGGALYTYRTHEAFAADRFGIDLRQRRGDDFRILDNTAIAALDGELAGRFERALYRPTARFTPDPQVFTETLATQFVEAGGELLRARVDGFERDGRRVRAVTTSNGRVEAGDIVLAAGVWSGPLARQLGLRVPLCAERGYGVHLPEPGVTLKLPMVAVDFHLAFRQTPTGLQVLGVDELAKVDAPPDYNLTQRLLRGAKRLFPELRVSGATRWMHSRPSTPDSLPVIGVAPQYDNAFLAFGHGHKGLGLGGITGKLVQALVDGKPPGVDLAPYSPTRFSRRRG